MVYSVLLSTRTQYSVPVLSTCTGTGVLVLVRLMDARARAQCWILVQYSVQTVLKNMSLFVW